MTKKKSKKPVKVSGDSVSTRLVLRACETGNTLDAIVRSTGLSKRQVIKALYTLEDEGQVMWNASKNAYTAASAAHRYFRDMGAVCDHMEQQGGEAAHVASWVNNLLSDAYYDGLDDRQKCTLIRTSFEELIECCKYLLDEKKWTKEKRPK